MRQVPVLTSVEALQIWFEMDAAPIERQLIARPYDEVAHYHGIPKALRYQYSDHEVDLDNSNGFYDVTDLDAYELLDLH